MVPDTYEGTGIVRGKVRDYYRCARCGGQYSVVFPHVENPRHDCPAASEPS